MSVKLTLLATLSSLAAAGTLTVTNHCSYPVYVNAVCQQNGGCPPSYNGEIPASGAFSQPIQGLGNSVQVSLDNTFAAETQASYSVSDQLYYALGDNSNSFSALKAQGVSIIPSDASCPSIVCPAGDDDCAINATKACGSDVDLTYTICVPN